MHNPHKQRLALLLPFWRHALLAVCVMLLGSLIQLSFPKIVSMYLDGQAPLQLFSLLNGAVLLGALVFSAVAAWRFYLFQQLGYRVINRFKAQLHQQLLIKDASYFDSINVAEQSGRIAMDTEELRELLTTDMANFVRATVITIGAGTLMFMTSWQLSLIMLVIAPTFYFGSRYLISRIERVSQAMQQELATSNQVAFDNLNCHTLVKLYHFKPTALRRYQTSLMRYFSCASKLNRTTAYFQGFFGLVTYLCMGVILIYGAFLVNNQSLTLGTLSAFVLYLGMAYTNLNFVAGFWALWHRGIGATNHLFDTLASKTPAQKAEQAQEQDASWAFQNITMDNVSFHYPQRPEANIINHLSLNLSTGEKLALMAPSGFGKSTLVKLMMGLYQPTHGEMTLNGQAYNQSDVAKLRAHTAYVEQSPSFFSGSILENLLPHIYTPTEKDKDAAIQACKMAQAHEFITALPEGYNTHIGDRGAQLSGGQKQRIALARALVKDPELLILDEFSSAIDHATTELLTEMLCTYCKCKTLIIITHQMPSADLVDRVVDLTALSQKKDKEHPIQSTA